MVLREHDVNSRGAEKFDDLVRHDPETVWKGVLGVLAATSDEFTLSVLAAGPLDDLTRLHGNAFIGRIEDAARRDPKFKELLHGVWLSTPDPTVSQRVVRARGRCEQ